MRTDKMLKGLALVLGLSALLALTACGGGAGSDDGGAASDGGEEVSEPSGAAESEGAGGAEAQESGEAPYVFVYNGVEVPVDAEAGPVLAALGPEDTYFEAASCAFEGLDKFYSYASFEVDTYPMGETDYISMVLLKDDLVSTPEGICIGDSGERLLEVYGEPVDENGTLVYAKGGMKLCFVVEEGTVAAIEYRTTALDA